MRRVEILNILRDKLAGEKLECSILKVVSEQNVIHKHSAKKFKQKRYFVNEENILLCF